MEMKLTRDDVPSLMKRAMQMARSGEYEFLYQIERLLKAEGYRRVEVIFDGDPSLRKEVRRIIGERRSLKPTSAASRPAPATKHGHDPE